MVVSVCIRASKRELHWTQRSIPGDLPVTRSGCTNVLPPVQKDVWLCYLQTPVLLEKRRVCMLNVHRTLPMYGAQKDSKERTRLSLSCLQSGDERFSAWLWINDELFDARRPHARLQSCLTEKEMLKSSACCWGCVSVIFLNVFIFLSWCSEICLTPCCTLSSRQAFASFINVLLLWNQPVFLRYF